MKQFVLPAIAALSLAACGGGTDADSDGDGEVTFEEAQALAERSGERIKPQAGKYRAQMTFVNADIPNAPEGVVEMMGEQMSRSYEFCLTPEQAEQGFGEAMRDGQSENCTIGKFSIDGNQMDMSMTCDDPDAGQMEMTMTGTVGRTSSDITMVSKGVFGPMGDAEVEMNVKQERIGECDS
ncbi:MAG: DUF3617 domain-containing protein [Erythrobacter sp.]|uniref:DUF3617 domain-containing protein n=1 Tax=Erythrobacter sp. TaxID=1042 RepID=UPI003C756A82